MRYYDYKHMNDPLNIFMGSIILLVSFVFVKLSKLTAEFRSD